MLEPGDTAPVHPDRRRRPTVRCPTSGPAVVLYFYPADDTPGCTKEACGFRDAWDDIQELGAAVLGVSPDGAGVPPEVRREVPPAVHPALRPGPQVMRAYGAYGEKTMYGRKTVGVIRSTRLIGPDGRGPRSHWARVSQRRRAPGEGRWPRSREPA